MWIKVKDRLPLEGVYVNTKIDDENGCRNVQELCLQHNMFYMKPTCNNPRHTMYVYYFPTHWEEV